QTQGCCTSSCGLGGVSRRPETAADRCQSVSRDAIENCARTRERAAGWFVPSRSVGTLLDPVVRGVARGRQVSGPYGVLGACVRLGGCAGLIERCSRYVLLSGARAP